MVSGDDTYRNLSMADAVTRARELGFEVSVINRKGEYRFLHRGLPAPHCYPMKANLRRKDAPRALISLLRKAEKLFSETGDQS